MSTAAARERCPAPSPEFPEIAEAILQGIDAHRRRQGLAPLESDPCLEALAQEHSVEMARGGIAFEHSALDARLDAVRFPWRRFGENIAWDEGSRDPAGSAVRQWLDSASHRRTLEGDYRLTGIGVARGLGRRFYFTQIFVR